MTTREVISRVRKRAKANREFGPDSPFRTSAEIQLCMDAEYLADEVHRLARLSDSERTTETISALEAEIVYLLATINTLKLTGKEVL